MKLKIINTNKFIKSILLFIAILTLLLFIGLNNTYSKAEIYFKEEYISYGDTLWGIAIQEAENNKYYENKDIRYIVSDIKKTNHLTDSNLQEGQIIKIPNI